MKGLLQKMCIIKTVLGGRGGGMEWERVRGATSAYELKLHPSLRTVKQAPPPYAPPHPHSISNTYDYTHTLWIIISLSLSLLNTHTHTGWSNSFQLGYLLKKR